MLREDTLGWHGETSSGPPQSCPGYGQSWRMPAHLLVLGAMVGSLFLASRTQTESPPSRPLRRLVVSREVLLDFLLVPGAKVAALSWVLPGGQLIHLSQPLSHSILMICFPSWSECMPFSECQLRAQRGRYSRNLPECLLHLFEVRGLPQAERTAKARACPRAPSPGPRLVGGCWRASLRGQRGCLGLSLSGLRGGVGGWDFILKATRKTIHRKAAMTRHVTRKSMELSSFDLVRWMAGVLGGLSPQNSCPVYGRR